MPRKKRTASLSPVPSDSAATSTNTSNQSQLAQLNDWPTWANDLIQAFTTIVTFYEFLAHQTRSKVTTRPPTVLRFDAIESKISNVSVSKHARGDGNGSGNDKSSLTKYTLACILAIAPELVTAVHRTHAELDALSAQSINPMQQDNDRNAVTDMRRPRKRALDDPYSPYLSSSNNHDTAFVLVLELPPIPSKLLEVINHNSSSKVKRVRTKTKGQIDTVMIIQQRIAAFRHVLQQFLVDMGDNAEQALNEKANDIQSSLLASPSSCSSPTSKINSSTMDAPCLNVDNVLDELLSPPYYEGQVEQNGRRTFPACAEQFAIPKQSLSDELLRVLRDTRGIKQFYTHQAKALDELNNGKHVVVATSTSSGKSIIYQVPTLQLLEEAAISNNHDTRILWMFPTKALSRDQLDSMERLVKAHTQLMDWVQLAVHDGDTAGDRLTRQHARDKANILFSNPDTLHMSLLPYADRWHNFYKNLRLVVLDELHVYTGGFGANVAIILRRLRRICAAYDNNTVRFITCSATIANPVEHMANLFGLEHDEISLIETDGAPHGRKEFLVWNPPLRDVTMPELGRRRSILEGARLLAFLVERRVRSILFCRTRRVCELVLQQLHDLFNETDLSHLIPYVASYRSGYDPAIRRQIEKDMFSGKLLAVVATSALELGIDIGSLDAVVLVGVPWDKAALKQQIGRVGRRQQTSLAILVADEQPLDQYYSRRPDQLFDVAPAVTADWSHPSILGAQLQCAAYERVIDINEDKRWFGSQLETLCQAHLRRINSQYYRAHPDMSQFPPGQVAIRGRSNEDDWSVIDITNGQRVVLEVMDAVRALFSIYEGAIYLYQGKRYLVNSMNVVDRFVTVQQVHVSWLTQQRDYTNLDPLETIETRPLMAGSQQLALTARSSNSSITICRGIIQMTASVFGYYKIDAQTGRILDSVDVEMPSVVWNNSGVWFDFPSAAVRLLEDRQLDTEEAVHGVAHSCRNIVPSFVLCGAEDIRIECKSPHATRYRPPRLVLQDTAAGIGASSKIYDRFYNILHEAYQQIRTCSCIDGCPQCVNSPLCTERNQALSKKGALVLLEYIFKRDNE